jgi:protein-tyrosine phosphatase
MDMTWVTDRLGLGGGIWNEQNMVELVKAGVTHVVNMQIEFDDRPLCEPYDVKVLWNPTDDDFEPKSPELLDAGVRFALAALEDPQHKVYVHCAAGVHRAPMMTLAILRAMGWTLEDALDTVQSLRPVVDWAEVYVKSVEKYIAGRTTSV